MGKSRTDPNGNTREQKLLRENEKLKRQLTQLRKVLDRVDFDRYESIRKIVSDHYQEDRAEEGEDLMKKLMETWKCHKHNCNGVLELVIFNKVNVKYYYRSCNECDNRTTSKKYDKETVQGIIRNESVQKMQKSQ